MIVHLLVFNRQLSYRSHVVPRYELLYDDAIRNVFKGKLKRIDFVQTMRVSNVARGVWVVRTSRHDDVGMDEVN